MSVGTRQFVLAPDSQKSSFLHGGKIASVIRELQGKSAAIKLLFWGMMAEFLDTFTAFFSFQLVIKTLLQIQIFPQGNKYHHYIS